MFNPTQLCISECPETLRKELHYCDIETYEYALMAWENCAIYMDEIMPGADEPAAEDVAEVTINTMLDSVDTFDKWDAEMMPLLVEWTGRIAQKYMEAAQ